MRAHEAGWAHADGALRGPAWLREPDDVNALVPHLWSSTAHKSEAGDLVIGGVAIPDLVANANTPSYVLDEQDFRDRARAFRAFARPAARKLAMVNAAAEIGDLASPPGNRLEKLSGDRAGQYSIRINDQWRVCFRFDDGDAYDVEICDYH